MEKRPDRLRKAIELSRFPSIRKFHREFEAAGRAQGVLGVSMPTLMRHLQGRGEPPSVRWLDLFAHTAWVRVAWLEGDDGPPTQAQAEAQTVADREGSEGGSALMEDVVPYSVGLKSPFGKALSDLFRSFRGRDGGLTPEQLAQVARILESVAMQPLHVFVPPNSEPEGISYEPHWFSHYMTVMYTAITLAMPAAGQGYPVEEFIDMHRDRLKSPEMLVGGPKWLNMVEVDA